MRGLQSIIQPPNYNIDIANPFGGLNKVLGNELGRQQEQGIREDAMQVLQSGDTDAIASFMLEHPDQAAALKASANYKSEVTKNNAVESAVRILNGEPVGDVIAKRQALVKQEGGDATHTDQILEQTQNDPEAAKRAALGVLAIHSPETYKLYKEKEDDPLIMFQKKREQLEAMPQTPNVKRALTELQGKIDSLSAPPEGKSGKWNMNDGVMWNDTTGATLKIDTGGASAQMPSSLMTGIDGPDEEVQQVGQAMYDAYGAVLANGGKGQDAIKAANDVKTGYREDRARANLPQTLSTMFPLATPDEQAVIMAAAQAQPDAKAGITTAQALYQQMSDQKDGVRVAQDAVKVLEAIKTSPWRDVVGAMEGQDSPPWWAPTTGHQWDSDENTAIALMKQAETLLTLPNLKLLKGTMSDSDVAFLKSIAAGGLLRTQDEGAFEKNLNSLIEKLGKAQVPTYGASAAATRNAPAAPGASGTTSSGIGWSMP